MDVSTSTLCDTIDQLLGDFAKWEEPLQKYRAENFPRLKSGECSWEKFERGLDDLETALKAKHDPHPELFCLLEQLVSLYLNKDLDERTEIRAFVAPRRKLGELVWNFAKQLATRITSPEDVTILNLALAAISIENCGCDYRDTLTVLADLYVRAEEAGIDPKPSFEWVAALSTDSKTRGGCESLARMLRELGSYMILQVRRATDKPSQKGHL